MIERSVPNASELGAALGLKVTDAEPRRPHEGAPSLFHSFRAENPAPHRSSRISLFPYAHDGWTALVESSLTLEVDAWRAWWNWIRASGEPKGTGVWPVSPLFEPVDRAIRTFRVNLNDRQWVGYLRPMLEWTSLVDADLPESQVHLLWKEMIEVGQRQISPAVRRPLQWPQTAPTHPDDRRRLLTDGTRLVPSRWRSFDPEFRTLGIS